MESMMNAAHSLAGISGNIGARRMMLVARELQAMAIDSYTVNAPKLIGGLEKEFEYVRAEFESMIQQPV